MKRPKQRLLMMDAAKVARIGYRALMRGKPVVVAGWLNKAAASVAKALPGPMMLEKIIAAVNE